MKTIKEFIGDETIYDKENHIIRGLTYKYDGEDKQKIIKSQRIADVRGWRAIQNLFMNNDYIDLVSAEKFQDELGEFIAMSINEQLKKLNKMKNESNNNQQNPAMPYDVMLAAAGDVEIVDINNIPENFGLLYTKEAEYQMEMIKQYDDLRYSHLSKKEREADIKPIRNSKDNPKIGRNELCPCGSGKKYKRCCLSSCR